MSRWEDGGFKSRKLWFAFWVTGLMVVGAIWGSYHSNFDALYSTLVTGLVGIAGLLFTGNIAAKYVAGKAPDPIVAPAPPKSPSGAKLAAAATALQAPSPRDLPDAD
jgi:hypothetical protein